MSEMMTVESVLEADWLLQGYWTKPRFAFKTIKNQWSDVDVLSYLPEEKHLVISESKVSGTKRDVFAYTALTQQKYGNIFKFDNGIYLSFLKNIPQICQDGIVFQKGRRFSDMVNRLTVQLACNYFITEDVKPAVIETVSKHIREEFKMEIELDVRIETTLEVICRIIDNVEKSERGKRYGHPVIDIARELNRYLNPDVRNAGSKQTTKNVISELREILARRLSDCAFAVIEKAVE